MRRSRFTSTALSCDMGQGLWFCYKFITLQFVSWDMFHSFVEQSYNSQKFIRTYPFSLAIKLFYVSSMEFPLKC